MIQICGRAQRDIRKATATIYTKGDPAGHKAVETALRTFEAQPFMDGPYNLAEAEKQNVADIKKIASKGSSQRSFKSGYTGMPWICRRDQFQTRQQALMAASNN